ncbi:golgin subfamily A member 6-like protein 7 [Sphaeramia orbicularis]|uniref:Golgin subfamily A member 6-like protein 7 n=1 Tax=Sphaeramia orbicularis TaxID=375764 RepID=A0A672YPE8_9TELE|nr:golgin subfamily A member 6-like protein 7 [Sphaeramia orbicularis]
MEDMDDNVSSSGFAPLFIQEEDGESKGGLREEHLESSTSQSGLTFTGAQLSQTALMRPYLQEMDELLKSCEELTGIPFGSRFSTSLTDVSLSESNRSRDDITMETKASPQAYLSTNYLDTQVNMAGIEDQPGQGDCRSNSRCDVGPEVSPLMPLTSAGNKLSENMVEYENQLLGMLAMLEGCMEEAGMDYETQESQEYVHISKNTNHFRGTTLTPLEQGKPMKLETQTMPLQSFMNQDDTRNMVFQEGRREATRGPPQNSLFSCNTASSFLEERLERSGGTELCEKLDTDKSDLEPQSMYSGPQMTVESTDNEHMCCEETKTDYMSTEDEGMNTEQPDEEKQELRMDTGGLRPGVNDLDVLGSQLEECIEEVQRLEMRRKELLAEVLELRGHECQGETQEEERTEEQIERKVAELMKAFKKEEEGRREERKGEIQSIREERAEEERRMWKVNLERQGLQDELRKLKRRLFTMAVDGAHTQAALNTQHRHVELLKREEEKLQSMVDQLREEGSQIRTAHQQQVLRLEAEIHATSSTQISNTQEELTECRRHSCGDIQQYVQGGLKALEQRYEPILLALLKRREAAAGGLVKAKEQAQEMKAQLSPLREEIQKLKLQKACLEEKLKLIHLHRRENVGQYKETVHYLEERSRELRTELNIQKKNTKEMEELKERLNKKLLMYRSAIENHNKHGPEVKT